MKKYLLISVVIFFSFYIFGCGKKQTATEESGQSMSMEAMSAVTGDIQTLPETKALESKVNLTQPVLPPPGPYKPTAKEIQIALRNVGLYNATIDGKIGPLSKKAIEEFQRTNGLKVDSKVGVNTWAVLSKYLNRQGAASAPTKKR